MNVVERYNQKVFDLYMQTHPNADKEKVSKLISDFSNRNLKNVPCKMHNNMTHEMSNTNIIQVTEWVESREPIITGVGSFFKQHEEYLSPSITMLETLMSDRGVIKSEMFKHPKGSIEYNNLNTSQGNVKVIMNADYGGSGTPQSPFYSLYIPPATTGSAKNLTTTLICCLEFASGNKDRWAKCNSINELYDMIFKVLSDDEERQLISDVYSVDEVLSELISRVNDPTVEDMEYLRLYLNTLSPDLLTKLMLSFNIRLVLTKYLYAEMNRVMSYIKSHQLDLDNMTKETIHEGGYGVKPPAEIDADIKYMTKVILDNCIYFFIPNDVEVRSENMIRKVVCVTDTDSLMVHFASYIDEFQARVPNFKRSCINASAFGMRLFIEGIIPKFTRYFTYGCKIKDKYYQDKFIFKNEFAFLAMALAAKKMYASSMFVQEGEPRNIHEIAVTGLSFKKRDAAEFLEPIMLDLYDKKILTSETVDISGVLDEIYKLREDLKQKVDYVTSYYKTQSYKDPSAYDPNKKLPDHVQGSIVWNGIFTDQEILPMDRVIIVPISLEKLEQHQHDNPYLSQILEISIRTARNPKKIDPVICLPESYKEMPQWLVPVIDKEKLIDQLLKPVKQLLGLFGVVMPETRGGMIPSRMVYI